MQGKAKAKHLTLSSYLLLRENYTIYSKPDDDEANEDICWQEEIHFSFGANAIDDYGFF